MQFLVRIVSSDREDEFTALAEDLTDAARFVAEYMDRVAKPRRKDMYSVFIGWRT